MTVICDPYICMGATSYDMDVPGVSKALCAISYNGTLLGSSYTNETGHSLIIFDTQIPDVDEVDLVVTAYNKIPSIRTVTVNNAPYVPSYPDPENGTVNVDVNSNLSWTGGDPNNGDTVTYDVYFGTTNPPPNRVSNHSTTIFDPGILNLSTTYYWRIVTWDNHNVSTVGSVWEFQTALPQVPVNIVLPVDWNLITVPVGNNHMASNLAENISGCIMLSRFDSVNQTYKTYIVGGQPGFDFPIMDGNGYFVLVDQNSTLSMSGYRIDSVSVPLSIGWNMLGWYHSSDTTASSLSENVTGCIMVSWFDPISQSFKTYIVGGPPGFDFTISPGMGLFVLVDESSVWHGEG